jgi:quercetin dioxygenase-like cupin family protein
MKHFPDFFKNPKNKVPDAPEGMEGFLFEGADGCQVVFWENVSGGTVPVHKHDFWEYCYVVEGCYEGIVDGKAIKLEPGDECSIPPGVLHEGKHSANYRAIDIFGGPRVIRNKK